MRVFLWILAIVIFAAMAWIAPQGILDTTLYYSFEEAQNLISSLTPETKAAYLLTAQIDLGFILIYTALLFSYLKDLSGVRTSTALFLSSLPGFFDFIETSGVIYWLQKDTPPFSFLGLFTFLKWFSVLIPLGFYLRKRKSLTPS